ncbi:PREDICTED: uncharacterized protein LOC108579774 [Habropoda laboriosa]|uniref:uncharacterized protein LOC108579774 n=1 Tax=Habropoda laboriosa TaxID=597456 RepID=UPI00083CEB1D|nr:PREDICTED: uncharacterized protein LOC108579774 [Habropoda laboriosa]
MLCREVLSLFVLCFLVLVNGMPQSIGNQDPASAAPLFQFTNGGVRFNFGGYHAEAGLGGLLGGSRTGGGLHASAGTPWGAHAAAGLGGLLSGDNANAGGNLYARAGLGQGRHTAAAGLGGFLDGSGRSGSLASGELYAGATTGSHGVGVSSSGSQGPAPGPTTSFTDGGDGNGGGKPDKGRTNIQIIARSEKKPGKTVKVSSNPEGSTEANKQSEPPANKEIREVEAPAPPVPPLANEANEVVLVGGPHRARTAPKWILRKRFWGPRKQVILNSSVESQVPSDINTQQVSRRQAPPYPDNNNTPQLGSIAPMLSGNNGYYDNVFRIPISTLDAVNQLLNTNSG